MKRPSFFIVGAPKCGTTALYEYLLAHPDIFMPRKEVYYFGKDLHYRTSRPSSAYYHALFESAEEEQLAGEASVWYLLSTEAAEEIKAYDEEARIIIMLRDPVEMLHALHYHQLLEGNEEIEDFEEALAAEEERKRGERLPSLIGSPYEALQYREVAKYKAQVEHYLKVFGPERVRVIFFEDFIADPRKEYERTLEFLGLAPKGTPSFQRVNAPRKAKSKALRDLFKQRPAWLLRTSKLLLPSRTLRQSILGSIEKANQKPIERPPMKESTHTMLREEFRPDVKALGELLGMDLERYWWQG